MPAAIPWDEPSTNSMGRQSLCSGVGYLQSRHCSPRILDRSTLYSATPRVLGQMRLTLVVPLTVLTTRWPSVVLVIELRYVLWISVRFCGFLVSCIPVNSTCPLPGLEQPFSSTSSGGAEVSNSVTLPTWPHHAPGLLLIHLARLKVSLDGHCNIRTQLVTAGLTV